MRRKGLDVKKICGRVTNWMKDSRREARNGL